MSYMCANIKMKSKTYLHSRLLLQYSAVVAIRTKKCKNNMILNIMMDTMQAILMEIPMVLPKECTKPLHKKKRQTISFTIPGKLEQKKLHYH